MKQLFTVLLLLFLSFSSVQAGDLKEYYVCVICARDLGWQWENYPKYHADALFEPKSWWELDRDLEYARDKAAGKPILLDFTVHGNDWGLYLSGKPETLAGERATFGFVVNHICRALNGKNVLVLFESCYAGRAYKYTIRGGTRLTPYDCVEDFPEVPKFAMYGAGDSFEVTGQIMYLQVRYNFRKWWVDLTEYDAMGKNKKFAPLEEHTEAVGKELWHPTAAKILRVLKMLRQDLP